MTGTRWVDLPGPWGDYPTGTWDDPFATTGAFFFEPPKDESPRTVPGMRIGDDRFWSHFRRPPSGRSVFKLLDGRYTEIQPDDPARVAVWYLGGHIYKVDTQEAAALTAAGYVVTSTAITSPTWAEVGGTWADLPAGSTWESV